MTNEPEFETLEEKALRRWRSRRSNRGGLFRFRVISISPHNLDGEAALRSQTHHYDIATEEFEKYKARRHEVFLITVNDDRSEAVVRWYAPDDGELL